MTNEMNMVLSGIEAGRQVLFRYLLMGNREDCVYTNLPHKHKNIG